MIISTKRGTPAAELDKIIREFEAKGLSVTMIRGTDYNVFGLVEYVAAEARRLGVEAEFYQSNHEGDLVTAIQQAYGRMDGIVINAGAYTHTSIAILDALKAVSVPAAEVHISDVAKREDFRQVSYLGMACCCKFAGEGKQGYVHAMEKLIEIIRSKNT